MRTFAIGDIHGSFDALQSLVDSVNPQPGDRLILLGDLVDRGHRTPDVIQWAIDNPLGLDLQVLRGNHELMMLTAPDNPWKFGTWVAVGGKAVLASYLPEVDYDTLDPLLYQETWHSHIPEAHWQFLQATLPVYETESEIFVHAGVAPMLPLDQQGEHFLYWQSFHGIRPHQSGKRIICGHTSQRSGRPADSGYAVCIDTNAWDGGWLTCLEVATNHYWQANHTGNTREGDLQDLVPGRTTG